MLHFTLDESGAPSYDPPHTMAKALRNGIMLLTLLLVIIGGTGMISMCPCHEEIFLFSCACHEKAVSCGCDKDHYPDEKNSSPAVSHLCEHQQLEIDDLTVPVIHAPVPLPCIVWQTLPDFHHLARPLLLTSRTTDSEAPSPPDLPMNDGPGHEGFQRPLLI